MSKIELVNELHQSARKNFIRRSTVMTGIHDTLQADLVEMQPYKSKNKNMRYILTVINIFSKKAYAKPLKNKTANEVTQAMKSILDSLNHPIRHLHVDEGKEFYNSSMKKMLKDRNINLYSTYSTKKAAIVERFQRTLKSKMWKIFSYRGSYKWIDILDKLISDYNCTKHKTIKMKPNDVNIQNQQKLLDTVYNRKHVVSANTKPKFKIGDFVRLSKYKHVFEKGYTANYTTEVFQINDVRNTNPITYKLIDLEGDEILGSVYSEEMKKTNCPDIYLVERIIERKNNKVFVKWLGFDSNHNSWIDKDSIL